MKVTVFLHGAAIRPRYARAVLGGQCPDMPPSTASVTPAM